MHDLQQKTQLAQHQVLAPQMRQSLGILQATTTELRQMIRAELEGNPALEEGESAAGAEEEGFEDGEAMELWDEDWTDFSAAGAQGYDTEAGMRRARFLEGRASEETLSEALEKQWARTAADPALRRVAALLIGNLNGDGYLAATTDEIAKEAGVEGAEVEKALRLLQSMDPPGVGARDLAECLRLQLERLGLGNSLAERIVASHLELFGRKKFADIAAVLGVTVEEVRAAGAVIAGLNPKPGSASSGEEARVLSPDAVIEKVGDGYAVSLVRDNLPHLRISRTCRDLLTEPEADPEARGYLREKIRAGNLFLKAIQQRQETLLAIVGQIAERQGAFLERGILALVPMTMAQVAEATGMHETTVGRAVAGKAVATPQGVFEMKFFFTGGYRTEDGAEVSREGVREAVASLIRGEDRARPWSDQQMVERLASDGIMVARRTVAKYREQLGFLPGHLRKSF